MGTYEEQDCGYYCTFIEGLFYISHMAHLYLLASQALKTFHAMIDPPPPTLCAQVCDWCDSEGACGCI